MNLRASILTLFTFSLLLNSHAQPVLFAAKEKGKKFGYITEKGDYVIPPSFDEAGAFYQGIAVVKMDKKFGVINSHGEFLVKPTYEMAETYAPEGKITVMNGGKWGVIDRTGNVVIPLEHEYLSVFVNGYIVAGKYISRKGYNRLVCPLVLNEKNIIVFRADIPSGEDDAAWSQYECSQLFLPGNADKKNNAYSDGWPVVREGKLVLNVSQEGGPSRESFIILDLLSRKSVEFSYGIRPVDNYYGMREGVIGMGVPNYLKASMGDNLKDAYYDTTNFSAGYKDQPIFELNAQKVHPFFNGVAAIEKDEHWAFIDRQGKIISETSLSTKEYKSPTPMYFDGLIAFWKKGKAGFIDLNGKEVIPFIYDEFHPFEHAVTPVKLNGLYGLLKKDGTWAVPPRFQALETSPCPCYQ